MNASDQLALVCIFISSLLSINFGFWLRGRVDSFRK